MNWKLPLKLFIIAASILIVDFISKGLVNFYMSSAAHASPYFPFGGIAVFQNFLGIDFSIHHVTNRGAAWGIGGGFQNLILWLRVAVILGIVFYMKFSTKAHQYRYPLTLVIAGGLGNTFDYFIYGHVVDMFHFVFWNYSYPVFNIADASIFVGVVWLLTQSFNKSKSNVAAQN